MPKIRFNLLAGNTLARLAGVRALIEHADRSIPEMEAQVLKDLQARAESENWDYGDFDVERQRLQADYRHGIPKYAGYSGILLLCSVLETQLAACADQVAKDKGSEFRVKDINGSSLEAPARLVRNLTGVRVADDAAWSRLKDMQLLRNIIIHREEQKDRSRSINASLKNSSPGTTDSERTMRHWLARSFGYHSNFVCRCVTMSNSFSRGYSENSVSQKTG